MKKVLIITLMLIGLIVFSQSEFNKLSLFGFKSEKGSFKVVVDTEIARLRKAEKYIPLIVFIGHSENKSITLNRSSFVLVYPDGEKESLPKYEDVISNYGGNLMSNDYEHFKRIGDYAKSSYLSWKYLRKVTFFPNPATKNIMYDNVELPNRTYFKTLLYFPNKETNVEGTYKLIIKVPKEDFEIEVPFMISWLK